MKLRRLCPILLCIATLAAQSESHPVTIRKPISSLGEIRSEILAVDAGTLVTVTPQAGRSGSPVIETYIYDANKVLLAKDDPDTLTDHFEWRAGKKNRIYVVVINTAAKEGTVTIQISPADVTLRPRAASPDLAIMRVYYATDRVFLGHADQQYGSEPADDGHMEYGLCRVSIPRDHKMGELEGPSIWKLEFSAVRGAHVVILGPPARASAQDFFAEIQKEIGSSREKKALVFIHGFDNTFDDAVRRTAQISYDLGFSGLSILYSWPSHGKISPIGYNADLRNATLSVQHFERFLTDLTRQTGVQTVYLIAHSMGSTVLSRAMSDAALQLGNAKVHDIVLMAPDIDAALFSQLASAMEQRADRITLYASSKDEALKASSTYAGGTLRAGQGGANVLVLPGLDTVDASAVDTSLLGFRHQYYADSRAVMSDLFQLMQNKPPSERFGLTKLEKSHLPYWRFRP